MAEKPTDAENAGDDVCRSWSRDGAGSAACFGAWVQGGGGRGTASDAGQDGVLESERGWTRLFLGNVRRSKQDAIADHKIMANQPEGEYASSNWEDCSMWRLET